MPRKQISENDLVLSARAGAVPARRKPATTTRKPRTVSKAEPAAVLSVPAESATAAAPPAAIVSNEPTREQIASLAYALWESRGCQGGSPEEDWINAERQLRARG
jgi:hypothetical protein